MTAFASQKPYEFEKPQSTCNESLIDQIKQSSSYYEVADCFIIIDAVMELPQFNWVQHPECRRGFPSETSNSALASRDETRKRTRTKKSPTLSTAQNSEKLFYKDRHISQIIFGLQV